MTKRLLTILFFLLISSFVFSQEKPFNVKYRRSSLHVMVVVSKKFKFRKTVLMASQKAPFPDKYNDHRVGKKFFNSKKYPLTKEESTPLYNTSKMRRLLNSAASVKVDSEAVELPLKIEKYLQKEKIGSKLVAKWFNRQADGSFDWNLVADRGIFDASFIATKTAQASADGQALLKTAGFELIENTFAVINHFNFVSNERVAAIARKVALAQTDNIENTAMKEKALKAIDAAYEKGKEGYSIWATSYLYKLVWNDSVSAVFYKDYYMEKDKIDPKKKLAFENSDVFKLEFVGKETARALVTFSLKEKRTEEQVLEVATVRIIDNVYAKLQAKYDIFQTKTPLYTGDPITAKIGVKEGLKGGEKFGVFENNIDPKTGKATYNQIGTIKVDKNSIWDNSYKPDEIPGEKTGNPKVDVTTFKGSGKYYSGLLIKQIK